MDWMNAEEEESNRIDELDGFEGPSKKVFKSGYNEAENLKQIEFHQAPVFPCVYTDGATKQEKCMVVLMLYSGVKGISVDIITKPNSLDQILKVTYNWPTSMYNVESMFTDDATKNMLVARIDPKVIAVEDALKQYRANMEEAPTATIEIKLPVEVKIDPTTWTKTFNKKTDGGIVVFLEFECIRKDYAIFKSEKFLKID